MLYFIKLSTDGGVWANRDKALEYLTQGYGVYTDDTEQTLCTEEEILSDVESSHGETTETMVIISKARGRIELPMPLSKEDQQYLMEVNADAGN